MTKKQPVPLPSLTKIDAGIYPSDVFRLLIAADRLDLSYHFVAMNPVEAKGHMLLCMVHDAVGTPSVSIALKADGTWTASLNGIDLSQWGEA